MAAWREGKKKTVCVVVLCCWVVLVQAAFTLTAKCFGLLSSNILLSATQENVTRFESFCDNLFLHMPLLDIKFTPRPSKRLSKSPQGTAFTKDTRYCFYNPAWTEVPSDLLR